MSGVPAGRLWAVAGIVLACGAATSGPGPREGSAVELAESPEVVSFYQTATRFYAQLEGKRFNSLHTFRDPALRAFFRDERTFSDYYADLADDLDRAHFERNRPLASEVQEFLVDGPGRARVRVRIAGENGQPLRWWGTELVREDRWERREGRWVLVPGRL